MPTSKQKKISYSLPSVMTIETADSIKEEFCNLPLEGAAFFTLDASKVETLASPGAQLLLALRKKIDAAGGDWKITGSKPSFTQALQDMGLGWLLDPIRT